MIVIAASEWRTKTLFHDNPGNSKEKTNNILQKNNNNLNGNISTFCVLISFTLHSIEI